MKKHQNSGHMELVKPISPPFSPYYIPQNWIEAI